MVEIVAEISGNHGGDLIKALKLIQWAASAGCQYAKFQYYRPEDMPDRYEGDNDAMYRKLAVPDEWLPDLFYTARRSGIGLFASVFSARAVHELLKYDTPYIKIASPESTRLSLEVYHAIARAVPTDRTLIVSGGARDWDQVTQLTSFPMYCPPGHPPVICENDFRYFTLARPARRVGFSDHTPGYHTALKFISAGATMVEKHFKIDDDCVDAAFSADYDTMRQLSRIANG